VPLQAAGAPRLVPAMGARRLTDHAKTAPKTKLRYARLVFLNREARSATQQEIVRTTAHGRWGGGRSRVFMVSGIGFGAEYVPDDARRQNRGRRKLYRISGSVEKQGEEPLWARPWFTGGAKA